MNFYIFNGPPKSILCGPSMMQQPETRRKLSTGFWQKDQSNGISSPVHQGILETQLIVFQILLAGNIADLVFCRMFTEPTRDRGCRLYISSATKNLTISPSFCLRKVAIQGQPYFSISRNRKQVVTSHNKELRIYLSSKS